MQKKSDLVWIAVGVLAVLLAVWAFPRAFPLYPREWTVSKQEAETIALERLRDLGELPGDPYIVSRLNTDPVLEARLQDLLGEHGDETIRTSALGRNLLAWEVVLYSRSGRSLDWLYRAAVTPDGEVSRLRARVPPEEVREDIEESEARRRSDAFLIEQGFDLGDFAEPVVRSQQLEARTDLSFRYSDLAGSLSTGLDHGVEVRFAGDQLTGFDRYFEDPDSVAFQATLQPLTLIQQAWVFLPILLVPLVAIPFVRKYHAGEIGVRRGLHIAAIILGCGVVTMLFSARVIGADFSIGTLTRPQVTWVVTFQFLALFFMPMAILSFLSWSVGESSSRERHSQRLAAFDALFQGDWLNSTFARDALRGVVAGVAVSSTTLLLSVLLRSQGAWTSTSFSFGDWWTGATFFSIPQLSMTVALAVYSGLFGRLFLVSFLERTIGRWLGGIGAAIVGALIFFPPLVLFPVSSTLVVSIAASGFLVLLFLRYGILTAILAQATAAVVASSGPVVVWGDPASQLQSVIAMLGVAAPMLISVRYLWSERRFEYHYDDIPPHVRRIAERERQKVELETARRIQTSILPELPSELYGIKLSHSYIPATEVGGDFYDVLALEDGRLAVAVGDVAGHGVSSGLVMSMAKAALAVQVSFNAEVDAVFETLNRMVFQSARKRLLTTLCYALVDPERRELSFASAGHLFPYRITAAGEVCALESVSYPLGVRADIEVRVRTRKLASGDYIFMFSDGVVEARREGTDELFGFERLERSLRRHAGGSVHDLRRGVLEDLDRFAGAGPREDDLTVLALGMP